MKNRRGILKKAHWVNVALLIPQVILWAAASACAQGEETQIPPLSAPPDTVSRDTLVQNPPTLPKVPPAPEVIATPAAKTEEKPCVVAYAVGFGLSGGSFTTTTKYTVPRPSNPDADSTYKISEDFTGFSGIYFHFHVVKPEQKIYFAPNIVYCFEQKDIAGQDHYRRYIFLGGNFGLNLNPLIHKPLLVETFLEGGLGILSMETGVKEGDNNWHFLLAAMDILLGGRYWISSDFGVEATFRYINCFLDSGLNSENNDDIKENFTFNDYKLGIGIVVKP